MFLRMLRMAAAKLTAQNPNSAAGCVSGAPHLSAGARAARWIAETAARLPCKSLKGRRWSTRLLAASCIGVTTGAEDATLDVHSVSKLTASIYGLHPRRCC